jgi:hypothetical protein
MGQANNNPRARSFGQGLHSGGHGKVLCSCGNVIKQCRCPNNDAVIETRPHPACGRAAPVTLETSPDALRDVGAAIQQAFADHDAHFIHDRARGKYLLQVRATQLEGVLAAVLTIATGTRVEVELL